MVRASLFSAFVSGCYLFFGIGAARADEGMWPLNAAPIAEVKERGNFEMTPKFLEHAMRASLRLSAGGTGSFVSNNGLVMTNHHVASTCIQKVSEKNPAHDLMRDGFLAKKMSDEPRCPDLEANVLVRIEDVTGAVQKAAETLGAKATDAEKNTARKTETAKIEKACADKTGHRCDVVTLWAGRAYHLYEYERHQDVRLVFAPELALAFFGGDSENFTFPRHCLDVAFLRVYDKDAPLKTPYFFPFDKQGAQEGQLTFITGNPGSTDRFATVAKLDLLRTKNYPFALASLIELRDRLKAYGIKGDKEAKAVLDDVLGIENAIKAITGYLNGLKDPKLMKAAKEREAKLIAAVKKLPDKTQSKRLLAAWPKLAQAYKKHGQLYEKHAVLEGSGAGPAGKMMQLARHFIRLGDELPKPNEDRLKEYRESALPSLWQTMSSDAPIDEGLEIEKLTFRLEKQQRVLGKNSPLMKKALSGKTPRARAEEAVRGSKLRDFAFRKSLLDGGKAAVDAAQDPMIELMRLFDADARAIRKQYEDEVESIERTHAGAIAEAHVAAYGTSTYPDATFTPRINYGFVKPFEENGGKIPWYTTFAGLYTKHEMAKGAAPYALPKRWLEAKSKLPLDTPFNFVTTNDIIGGNSGSPTFGKNGKIVGLVFDGNLSQLSNRFLYREDTQRSVHVDAVAILLALDKVYGAQELLKELLPPS